MKKIFGLVLLITLVLSTFSLSYANEKKVILQINKSPLEISEEYGKVFIDENGRTQVPIRILAENIYCTIEWEQESSTVIINDNIKIKIGERIIRTPDGDVEIDSPAVIIDGRTYLPVRFISEVLGYKIEYSVFEYEGVDYSVVDINPYVKFPMTQEVNGEIVVDTSNGKLIQNNPGYTNAPLVVNSHNIGLHILNVDKHREEGTTIEEEYEFFNSLLGGGEYKVNEYGYIKGAFYEPPKMVFERDENNNPKIGIGTWALEGGDKQYSREFRFMNLTLEALNYYSNSTYEAKAIFDFINRSFKTQTDPEYGKIYRFGETRIKFTDEDYGVGIIIIQ